MKVQKKRDISFLVGRTVHRRRGESEGRGGEEGREETHPSTRSWVCKGKGRGGREGEQGGREELGMKEEGGRRVIGA